MANRQRQENPDPIRLLVQRRGSGQDFIIEVDPRWRITFGYVNPSKSSDGYARNEGHCLRVYEGEKLRAVFGDVSGFRDLSIPMAVKVTRETGSASWTRDSEGNFENSAKREVDSAFQLEAGDNEVKF